MCIRDSGEGAYTHEDKTVILTVVNRYPAIKLRKYTREDVYKRQPEYHDG